MIFFVWLGTQSMCIADNHGLFELIAEEGYGFTKNWACGSQNRFILAFQKCIYVFACFERPLVLILEGST